MMAHAYAPSRAPAPLLWARHTWVKELGLTWSELGGIGVDEINLLAELANVWHEAQALKARVEGGGQSR